MNGEPQQQGQGEVPLRDPKDPSGTVFMVPRAKVDGYVKQGAQQVPDAEFQKRYMIPSQKAAAAQKPSAALGPTGQPIGQPPVAAAGPTGAPNQLSTGVGYGAAPGGVSPATQAGSGALGVLGNVALGAAKEPAYQLGRMAQLPTEIGLGQSSVPSAIKPTGDAQKFGAGITDQAEYALPMGGEKAAVEWAGTTLNKIAPRMMTGINSAAATKSLVGLAARVGKFEAEQIAKATYSALVSGVAGGIQERDIGLSTAIGASLSMALGHIALMSPSTLAGVFGVKDLRGSAGEAGKMLAERVGGFRKATILKNAGIELNKTEAQLASMFATPKAGGGTIKVNLYTILRDLQDKASTINPQVSKTEADKITKLTNEMARFSESAADKSWQKLSGDIGNLKKSADRKFDLAQKEPNQLTRKQLEDAALYLKNKAFEKEKILANQFNEISGSKLNKLRKILEDEYLPTGKAPAYWTDSEKMAVKTYDKVVQALTRARPNSTQLIKDTYALNDILEMGKKKDSTAFGAHTLMDPGQLSRMLPGYLGFEFGRKALGLPGGIAGAIAGGAGGRPAVAAAARAVRSPYTTGAASGVGNLLLNRSEDWSTKGKKSPYQETME